MPLSRINYLSSAFLLQCLCWLVLGTGLLLPAEARTNRTHKTHRKHARRRIHIPRMLPTFIPAAREGYATVLRGRASWYGKYFQGKKTTSGERFNRHEYTCAHKTLPFGTRLRVTNLDNGVTVVVRVSDRGPFRHERIIDLAEVAARPLGLVEAGAATVVAEIVEPTTPLGLTDTPGNLAQLQAGDPNPHAPFTAYLLPEAQAGAPALAAASAAAALAPLGPLVAAPAEAAPRFVVQAGTYADPQNARAALARIQTIDQSLPAEIVATTANGHPASRVVVGQLDSWLAAETVRRNLQLWGMAALVCQVPATPTAASTEQVAAPLALAGALK
jgi:rare lipoprotein A